MGANSNIRFNQFFFFFFFFLFSFFFDRKQAQQLFSILSQLRQTSKGRMSVR